MLKETLLHTINSHVLAGLKPCINKANRVLLMQDWPFNFMTADFLIICSNYVLALVLTVKQLKYSAIFLQV